MRVSDDGSKCEVAEDEVLAVVRYAKEWRYHAAPLETWVMDWDARARAYAEKVSPVPPSRRTERGGIRVLNDESAPTALLASERRAISEPALCRLLRERLPFTDWFDVVRLSPSVFVDFDLRRLSYVYSEPCSLEAYLPAGWTGAYEDFFDRIPLEHRHWLREGVDYLAMALAALTLSLHALLGYRRVMGTSWTVSIELSGVDKEKWLRSKVGPSTFDDWPDLLDTEGTPVTVKAVLSALEKASPKCVAWDGDALRGTASLDADGAFWIDRRSHLAAAFRSAGKLGGKGELVIAPAGDNAASDVILVSASGTAKRVTGRAKTSLLERIAPKERAAEQRVVAEVTAAARARPIVSHDGYRAVHEEIVAALRRADRAAVLAASRTVQREIALTRGGAVPFATRYDDAETLLAALEHGDPEAHVWIASTFAAASLDLLALVAPETASELARRILAIGGPVPHGLHSFVDAAVGVAAAGLDTTGQLEALRKHAPRADNRLQLGLFGHPVVARLARGSRDTRDAVRDQITKVLGAPGEWRSISEPDASFGFALAVLLAAHATRVDEKLLAALHTHPHWMVAAAKSPRFQPDRRSRGA